MPQSGPPSLPFFPKDNPGFVFWFWLMVGLCAVAVVAHLVGWWMNIRRAKQARKRLDDQARPSTAAVVGATGQNGGTGATGQNGCEKPYTLDDLRADLLNPNLSIEEILPKCSKLDPADIEKVVSTLGPGDSRKAQRLAWYMEVSKNMKKLQLTAPPPKALVVKASMEICPRCADRRKNFRENSHRNAQGLSYVLGQPEPLPPNIYCEICGGKGFYYVQRG